MKACVFGSLGLLLLAACNDQEPPPQPGSFDRPNRVAFACFDMRNPERPRVASLDQCDLSGAAISGDTITHNLHALVVQSSRGEVGAVDVVKRLVLDSRRDIPGYTFLPVGELPTAIVVPAQAPHADFTYVANAGSRDITVLKTQAFRELGSKESPTMQTLPLPGGSHDSPLDMVIAPAEDALFVSIPETGRLLRVPIKRCDSADPAPSDAGMSDPDASVSEPQPCTEGELDPDGIVEIPLADSIARAMGDNPADIAAEKYAQTCDYKGAISNESLPLPELPADLAQTQPQPSGMAVDNFCEGDEPCRPRLLVADRALPLIHVIDLAAFETAGGEQQAIQPPIRTGVPTSYVAVTPRVPVEVTTNPDVAATQYVYAIDATDGSVLVTENGRLLAVGADGSRRDRITLGSSATVPIATSLSVLSPAYDVHGRVDQFAQIEPNGPNNLPLPKDGNFCTDTGHPTRSNLRLRGVFLSVGITDGSVRIIDIHDMDLPLCRSCTTYRPTCECVEGEPGNMCDKCLIPNWDPYQDPYPVVRHRTRIAPPSNRTADPPPLSPVANPVFATTDGLISISDTGSTNDPALEGLDCVRCVEGKAAAFPMQSQTSATVDAGVVEDVDGGIGETPCGSGSARVCALDDTWAELEDWRAYFLGVIPGSRGGEGKIELSGARVELQASGKFCGRGVLGQDVLGPKAGDSLSIVGPLAPDSAIKDTAPQASDLKSGAARTFESDVLDACRQLVNRRDGSDNVPIAFTIQQAYDDRLVLAPNLVTRLKPEDQPAGFDNDAQLVSKCFGKMPLTYEVRAGAGYIVVGLNRAGFVHRVRAEDGSGHCVLDQAQNARRTGRAYDDEPFDNGYVTFQIRKGEPAIDTALLVGLGSPTAKMTMNASVVVNEQVVSSIPVDLRWSDGDDTLYMVDISSRGLVQIPVDPFPTGGVSRSFQ
jgi:hypothetical protein